MVNFNVMYTVFLKRSRTCGTPKTSEIDDTRRLLMFFFHSKNEISKNLWCINFPLLIDFFSFRKHCYKQLLCTTKINYIDWEKKNWFGSMIKTTLSKIWIILNITILRKILIQYFRNIDLILKWKFIPSKY
jgi:hypothetical protein